MPLLGGGASVGLSVGGSLEAGVIADPGLGNNRTDPYQLATPESISAFAATSFVRPGASEACSETL